MKELILNEDQHKIYTSVVKDILYAYHDTQNKQTSFISITGSAGTGKTSLANQLIQTLIDDADLNIAVLAPTHKALNVIKESINSDSENIIYATVHSFLGLRPVTDFKTGNITYTKDYKFDIYKDQIINLLIIDESSFISAELFKHIKNNKKASSVLFLGDELQLVPVEDTSKQQENIKTKSAIFSTEAKNHIKRYNLSKVIRNGNDEVLDFYIEIRNMLMAEASKHELFAWLHNEKEKSFNNIHFFDNKQEFLIKYMNNNALYQDDEAILTFTNKKVQAYNDFIREQYLKAVLPSGSVIPQIHNTDVFVFQSSCEPSKHSSKYMNSEVVYTKSYTEKTVTLLKRTFDCYQVFTTDDRKFLILKDSSREYYNNNLDVLKQTAIEGRSSKDWKQYYDMLGLFPETKYQYSMTIHKSQGSSMSNVYVDCTDIDYVDSDTMLRLFYVACTRSKNEINILL